MEKAHRLQSIYLCVYNMSKVILGVRILIFKVTTMLNSATFCYYIYILAQTNRLQSR